MSCTEWCLRHPWAAVSAVLGAAVLAFMLSGLHWLYEHQPPPLEPVMVGVPTVAPAIGTPTVITVRFDHHYAGPCVREGQYSLSQGPTSTDAAIHYYPLGGALNGYGQRSLGPEFSVEFLVAPDVHGGQVFWFRAGYWCPIVFPLGLRLFEPPILARHWDYVARVDVVLP
jgi:hypothetical protein